MIKYISFLLVVFCFSVSAQNTVVKQTNDVYIVNDSTNAVALKVIKPAANVADFLSFGTQTNTWFAVSASGAMTLDKTVTPVATTGTVEINKAVGSVNFAALATSLVVTNSLVTTNSVILATVATNDASMFSVQVVAGSGQFTLYAPDAPTGTTRVNFFILQ